MPKYQGNDTEILRIAGPNDQGYDRFVQKVWVKGPNGEMLVRRLDLDERDDMTDEERLAADKAMGKTEEQSKVDAIRREAALQGRPPDQTPAPFVTNAQGRQVPNPDAEIISGQAATLEQEKQSPPTIDRGRDGNAPKTDRGDGGRNGAEPSGIERPNVDRMALDLQGDADARNADARRIADAARVEEASKRDADRADTV